MFAIYKRELKSYFSSFIGFLFIAVTLFFLGLYFSVYNLMNGYPYFAYVIADVAFLFFVSVPILTMRVLAEERKTKTDQLILTAPVSVTGVVLGKFMALLTVFLIPVIIICFYPLIMSQYGVVPMGETYLAILTYFLYGMTALAIGLFISSLTESQVIAAVLGVAVLFVGYIMSSICSMISSTGNLLTKILSCFDLYSRYVELLSGALNLDDIVYYLSVTILVLFLTVQSIQKRRYSVSVKHLSVGAYSTGMIALAVVIVVGVNVVIGQMPANWTSIDLTSQKLYSLTDQTKEYVANIQDDVTIYVLADEDTADVTLQQTLQKYDGLSDHITVEYVNTAVNPTFYTQYAEEAPSSNSLIVVSEKRNKVIDYSSVYETSYDYTNYTSTTSGYDGEGQITSALDYVLSDNMPKIYMTEGHGEYELSSSFTTGLQKENVEYEIINLMNYDAVPEDAACLMIHGAGSDFSTDDKDKVIAYLENGGKIVVVTSYTMDTETPNLDAILAYMGMQIVDGLIVEQNPDNYYRSPYYLLPNTSVSTYTSGIHGSYYVFAPFAQGVVIDNEEAEGMAYTTFLTTSEDAFSKISLENMENYEKEEGDIEGPFRIGVEAVKTLDAGEATMVVYGCEEIFTEDANEMVSGSNLTMFTNTIGNLVDHEVSISIPAKSYDISLITIPQNSVLLLAPLVTVILPLGLLVIGFVIWFKRRKR